MKLDDWRRLQRLTFAMLAARLNCGASRAYRLCRKGALPDRAEMARIRAETGGAVLEADFYRDHGAGPPLSDAGGGDARADAQPEPEIDGVAVA